MLLAGGRLADGSRLLSKASVDAMTTDQLGIDRGRLGRQRTPLRAGVSVSASNSVDGLAPGRVATDGLADWARPGRNDPTERLVGIVLTTDVFTSPFPPPPAVQDFWTCVYTAIDD